ncbi:MAG: hypothetical protein QGG36_31800 [Pirellulaceae bacterium]|jgi:hypothetical protein|nr:hypothetical protein [Pirellulaceae bacterium]MDP7020426.1 hypothetical protein [Pirellulaceae bacterium]
METAEVKVVCPACRRKVAVRSRQLTEQVRSCPRCRQQFLLEPQGKSYAAITYVGSDAAEPFPASSAPSGQPTNHRAVPAIAPSGAIYGPNKVVYEPSENAARNYRVSFADVR